MNILIIGGGAIANYLRQDKNRSVDTKIDFVGLRDFSSKKRSDKESILCKGYDRIVYLGYHKKDPRMNIYTVALVGNILKEKYFKGEIIFVSSHASIASHITKQTSMWDKMFFYTRYFYVKRMQEWIIQRSEIQSRIIYLPIVTGLDDNRDEFFDQLASMAPYSLPDRGENSIYILSAESLSAYMTQRVHSSERQMTESGYCFLFSKYCSLNEYLSSIRKAGTAVDANDVIATPPSPDLLRRYIGQQYLRELMLFILMLFVPSNHKTAKGSTIEVGKPAGGNSERSISTSKYLQFSLDHKSPSELKDDVNFSVVSL